MSSNSNSKLWNCCNNNKSNEKRIENNQQTKYTAKLLNQKSQTRKQQQQKHSTNWRRTPARKRSGKKRNNKLKKNKKNTKKFCFQLSRRPEICCHQRAGNCIRVSKWLEKKVQKIAAGSKHAANNRGQQSLHLLSKGKMIWFFNLANN